jgi:hypothetical protein
MLADRMICGVDVFSVAEHTTPYSDLRIWVDDEMVETPRLGPIETNSNLAGSTVAAGYRIPACASGRKVSLAFTSLHSILALREVDLWLDRATEARARYTTLQRIFGVAR